MADFVGDVNANYCLFGDNPLTHITVVPVGGVTSDKNINGVGPKLGALKNNGGPTETQALLAGSPAINKGANPNKLTTDQRGFQPRNASGKADIGADELGAG
jgi:hypothetical protein